MSVRPEREGKLVEWAAAGDRDAFGRIVRRYQSLVCAITYSGTGDIHASEDLSVFAGVAADTTTEVDLSNWQRENSK